MATQSDVPVPTPLLPDLGRRWRERYPESRGFAADRFTPVPELEDGDLPVPERYR